MTEDTYQMVINHTLRWIDYIHSITVTIKPNLPYGMGFPRTKEIVLPDWLSRYDPLYRMYYVLHEMVHCMVGIKHDATFMRVEDVILSLWDIKIVRKKVYPKQLFWKDQEIENIPSKERKNGNEQKAVND